MQESAGLLYRAIQVCISANIFSFNLVAKPYMVGIGKSTFIGALFNHCRGQGYDVVMRRSGWNCNMNMVFSHEVISASDYGLKAYDHHNAM